MSSISYQEAMIAMLNPKLRECYQNKKKDYRVVLGPKLTQHSIITIKDWTELKSWNIRKCSFFSPQMYSFINLLHIYITQSGLYVDSSWVRNPHRNTHTYTRMAWIEMKEGILSHSIESRTQWCCDWWGTKWEQQGRGGSAAGSKYWRGERVNRGRNTFLVVPGGVWSLFVWVISWLCTT